jgi:signal peptidase I
MPIRLLITLCLTLAALPALLRRLFVVVVVDGISMSPTLAPGDRMLGLRRWPRRWLRNGQIVVVAPGDRPECGLLQADLYIKRIVGSAGDTLVTTIDQLSPALRAGLCAAHDARGQRSWHIPAGRCFVRGDHPRGGFDSLAWGPIPLSTVRALVVARLPGKAPAAASSVESGPAVAGGPTIGARAPDFAAPSLDGAQRSLSDYAGRKLLLVTIAPGDICAELLPAIAALAPLAAGAGAELLLVSRAEAGPTEAFLAQLAIGLPTLSVPPGRNPMLRDYDVIEWPSYCLIDEQGVVRMYGYPSESWDDWCALVASWRAGAHRSSQRIGLEGVLAHD